MNRKMFIVLLVILGIGTLADSAVAQQFWDKKDYSQWSKGECKRLLEDSPWSVRHDLSTSQFSLSERGGTGTTDGSTGGRLTYIIQLRSVLPVRQAVVRCAQFEMNYDKMGADQKRGFDARVNGFLSVQPEPILVHVTYDSNQTETDRSVASFWQTQTLETLKDKVFLITQAGERIAPVKFSVLPDPGREFEFEFPRLLNGKPVLAGTDKSLRLEMNIQRSAASATPATPSGGGRRVRIASNMGDESGTDRVTAEFKVVKMTYKGKLVY